MMDRLSWRIPGRRAPAVTSWRRTIQISIPIRGWSGSGCGRASDVESHPPARRPVMKIRLYGFVLAVAVATCVAQGSASPPAGTTAPRAPYQRAGVTPVAREVSQARAARRARLERDQRVATPAGTASAARIEVFNQSRRIDINNINMFVTNYGTFANDIENQGNSGLFFPKGTIKTAVYQSGIWLVGKVGSEI